MNRALIFCFACFAFRSSSIKFKQLEQERKDAREKKNKIILNYPYIK